MEEYSTPQILAAILASILVLIMAPITTKKHPKVRRILLLAFVIRLIMAWFYSFNADADPDGYTETAMNFSQMDFGEYIGSFQTGAYLYSWLIAGLWKFTGINTIIIRIINALLSYLCCLMGYQLTQKLFRNEKASRIALISTAVFPNLLRFSAQFASRESLFVFLLMLALSILYEYYQNRKISYALIFIVIAVIGIFIHISMIGLFVIFVGITVTNIKKKSELIKAIFLTLVIVLGGIFMLKNNIGTEKLYLNKGGLSNDKVAWIQESSADGRAAYLAGFSSNNLIITLLRLPVRMIFFLYTPFIWMVSKLIDLLGLLDAILYVAISVLIFKSRKQYSQIADSKFIKLFLLSMFFIIALMSIATSNYGTAIRHRAKIAVPLICLVAPALVWQKERRKNANLHTNAIAR